VTTAKVATDRDERLANALERAEILADKGKQARHKSSDKNFMAGRLIANGFKCLSREFRCLFLKKRRLFF
jgi:hypothetical protein